MTNLRVLVVEDSSSLVGFLVRTVSDVWESIRSYENNPYSGIEVEKAKTEREAKDLIRDQAPFDLFILDLCIPKEINSQTGEITGTYNGLHLIAFADNKGRKPKSAISLTTATGEGIPDEVNSDMGRDYLEGYFHKDNFVCLHKGRDDNSAI